MGLSSMGGAPTTLLRSSERQSRIRALWTSHSTICAITFASWMVMSGASLRTVADQLGHRDIRMVMRYAHLSASHRANAMSQLDNVFAPPVCDPRVTPA